MRVVHMDQARMKALREYAEAHPQRAQDVLEGKAPPAGDIPAHVLALEGGVRVVFSVESDQPAGPCRHLSVSVNTVGRLPDPAIVILIGQELGFRPSLGDGSVWVDGATESVNWVQTLDPPTVH